MAQAKSKAKPQKVEVEIKDEKKKEIVEVDPKTNEVVRVVEEAEEAKPGFLGNVGNVAKKIWKPVVGGIALFGAGFLTAILMSPGESSEDNDEDDEDEEYSILDEEL